MVPLLDPPEPVADLDLVAMLPHAARQDLRGAALARIDGRAA